MPRLSVSTLAIALISSFGAPAGAQVIYQENFDAFSTCGTSCGNACDLTGTGWTNVLTDDMDWTVDANGTGSSNTGPSGDNTTGAGNYLYTETSGSCSDSTAELLSPVISLVGSTAPVGRVYYHMYGGDQGNLHVDLIQDPNNTAVRTTDVVPPITDNVDAWQLLGCIPLDPAAGEVQVVFRGETGPGYESDMAIDDFIVEEAVGADLAVTGVRAGGGFCSTTANVEVDIANLSGAASGATVQYTVNGGTPVVENLPAIAGCGIITHTFAAPVTLTAGANTTIVATVTIAGDSDPTNDSGTVDVFTPSLVTSLPYSEDFENGNGGWYAAGTPTWEHGAPAGSVITTANSGTQAWMTGLATDYPSNSDGALMSPCFDASSIVNPRFEAFANWEIEAGFGPYDGAQVQTSTDGINWVTVGDVGPGWYTQGGINGLNEGPGFTGRQSSSDGSNGWVPVGQDLGNGTTGLFQIRILMGSDGSVQEDGIAFDDIRIVSNPPALNISDVSIPNVDPSLGGDTNIIVQALVVEAFFLPTDINSATLNLQGTIADSDITAVNLWLDDGDGIAQLGTNDIQLTAPGTFSGGSTTFTFAPALSLPANGVALVYVTVDLAVGVAGGLSFGTEITMPSQVVHTGTQPVQFPNGPVAGPLSTTFQAVDMLPFVDNYDGGAAPNRISVNAVGTYPTATSTGTVVGTSATTSTTSIVAIVPGVNTVTPNSGTGMAAIAFLNGPATGAIDYYFDLSSYDVTTDEVFVEFFHENVGATDDPEDHVFLSLDGGATWAGSVYDFDNSTAGPSAWSQTQINLSAFMRAASLTLTNNVVIRMQAAGDGDAVVIDDVFAGIPEAIRVERMAGMPILSGGTDDLGTIPGGTQLVATYTVHNDGQRPLMVMSSTIALANVTNVTVMPMGPDVTVAPAGSATIAFGLNVPVQGAFSADVSVATNDPRLPGAYTMTVSGIGAFDPDIALTLADGTATPSGSAQDLGQVQLGGAVTIDMIIANTGGLDLNLTGTPVVDLASQVNLSAATVSSVPSTLAADATASFTITLTPAARGAFSTQVVVASNDPDENPYTIDISGMAMEADIAISRGGTAVASGATDDLGMIEVNAAQTLTYTIANAGNQDLGLSGTPAVTLNGVPANVDATVTTQPGATIAAGMSSDAVVTVTATGEGAFSFDMTVASNDPDTPTYTVTVSGTGFVPAPEITVTRGGSEVTSGTTENVGGVAPGVAQTLTYTIGNSGNVDLTVSGAAVSNTTNVTASVTTAPAGTVAAGGTTSFVVSYTATAEGAFSFDITVESNDADEGTYTISVAGTGDPLAPEIAVSQGGNEQASGSTVDVGDVQVGNKSTLTFQIANEGQGDLTLTGEPTLGGLTNATATLDAAPDTTIAAGASTTFTVSVSPTAAGAFSAVVTVGSNDGDEGTYTVTISGNGTGGGTDPGDDDGGCTCVTDDGAEAPVTWLGFAAFGLLLGLRRRRR